MKKTTTNRGFARVDFNDGYGHQCSLQESSSIEPHIWLGMNSPDLKEDGWHPESPARMRPFALGPNQHAFSRMHLSQEQVRQLLPLLQEFAETGELND